MLVIEAGLAQERLAVADRLVLDVGVAGLEAAQVVGTRLMVFAGFVVGTHLMVAVQLRRAWRKWALTTLQVGSGTGFGADTGQGWDLRFRHCLRAQLYLGLEAPNHLRSAALVHFLCLLSQRADQPRRFFLVFLKKVGWGLVAVPSWLEALGLVH